MQTVILLSASNSGISVSKVQGPDDLQHLVGESLLYAHQHLEKQGWKAATKKHGQGRELGLLIMELGGVKYQGIVMYKE